MVKIIKKSIKYLTIFVGIVIMFPTMLYLLIQIPQVQTLLVRRIANHVSSELKSTISFSSIEYKFFNKLSINDILIKDQNNDTLIYSRNLNVGFKIINLKTKALRLGRVTLIKPVIAFITDSTGVSNISWYLNLIKGKSDTIKKAKSAIRIEEVDISDARFSLINHNGIKGKNRLDFNNLNIKSLNCIVEDLRIENDSTSFDIYNLAFTEKSGFSIRRMSSSVMLSKQNILIKSFNLRCDSSTLNIEKIRLTADSASSFKNFAEKVKLDIILDKSRICSTDLQYFLPIPAGLDESLWLSGNFAGTVSELRGRNINLSYRDYTTLDCDFDLSGLPKIENAYVYIGVNSLKTNARDIEKIKIPGKDALVLPDALYKLGDIMFDGSFTGFITDFVTYGKFRTNLGNIRTDISLRPEESDKYKIKGLLSGSNIDLGELTGKTDLLGKVSIQANVDGYAYSLKKFAANLTGKIDSVEINKYMYRNIDLKGFFTEKTWDGSINITDTNIKLDLLGTFNFKNKLPEFDFTLNLENAKLYKLNIDKLDTTSTLTMLLTSNFKGTNIDNLDGEIKLLNSSFIKYNKTIDLYDFSVRTFIENNKPALSLRTDFLDADLKGEYNFGGIAGLIRSSLSEIMPSQFPTETGKKDLRNNNFTFNINFKNTDKINNFFKTGLVLADKSYISGSVFPDSIITVVVKAPLINFRNFIISDLDLNSKLAGAELSIDLKSSSFLFFGQTNLKDFSIGFKTKPDNFILKVDWDNKDKILDKGSIVARGSILKDSIKKAYPALNIVIDSTHIYARNIIWKISHSTIRIDTSAIKLNKIFIGNNDHYYLVDGALSRNPADTLHLQFRGIDISPLNYIIYQNAKPDPTRIPLNLKGLLNGKILLTNVFKNPVLEGYLVVNNFSLLDNDYGNIAVVSNLDNTRKVINIDASNNLGGVKMFTVNGFYDPRLKKINLEAKATHLPIGALNPLLKTFASQIKGVTSGKVRLSGTSDNLVLQGALKAENASMKINYLQTTYKMDDTVRFDKSGIKFNTVRLTDEEGKMATLTGTVYHKNFKEYSADISINIISNDFLALNTQVKDNPMFYGKVYASAQDVIKIKTGPNLMSFDISAKTGKNSKFFIPLNNGLSVAEYPFVSFVDPAKEKDQTGAANTASVSAPKQLGMDINIDLTVTPDAVTQLIFDPKVGDKMTGSGSGILNITLNKNGDFRINGDYNIEKGDYLFTLRNIVNKKFDVERGGKIMFNGKLDDAEIDLKAIYQKFTTSLFPLTQDEQYKVNVSVEPQLLLTSKLFNPSVAFDIYLPDADESTRAIVKNAITTEEEMNRQFLFLLVTKSFYSEQTTGATAASSTSTGTSAMAVTTFEMISNQLSNWLSQINKDLNLGFSYKPGSGTNNIDPKEVNVDVSTQILKDKVALNGNFNYIGLDKTTGNADQLTGDFDAEITLTEKIHLKVFNRFNDTYSGKGPYTQGFGIQFKEDFTKFSDLFKRKTKSDMKKEEVPSIKKK